MRFALCCAAVSSLLWLVGEASRAQDLSAESSAVVHDIMDPFVNGEASGPSVATNLAVKILKNKKLIGGSRPAVPKNNLVEQYGPALALGTRAANFAAQIAAIHDAFLRNDSKGVRDAIRHLWQDAGRSDPDNETLTKMVEKLKEIEGGVDPVEHAVFDAPDGSVDVTWEKATGKVKIEVTDPNGPNGQPVRTTFTGDAKARPDATGKSVELKGQPSNTKPREVTEEQSKNLREKIAGKWMDQDGHPWLVNAGKSIGITVTQYRPGGHKVVYDGDFKLAKIAANHTIKDPKDISEGLPESVKEQLASKYHPLYKVRLDANDAGDRLEGIWISKHVTYDGLSQEVEKIGDDFNLPLVLTRPQTSGTALGMKDGDFP